LDELANSKPVEGVSDEREDVGEFCDASYEVSSSIEDSFMRSFVRSFIHSFIHLYIQAVPVAPLRVRYTTQRRARHSTDTVPEFHTKVPQATARERLAKGPYTWRLERIRAHDASEERRRIYQ